MMSGPGVAARLPPTIVDAGLGRALEQAVVEAVHERDGRSAGRQRLTVA